MLKILLNNEYKRLLNYLELAYKETLDPIDFSKMVLTNNHDLGTITHIDSSEITKYLLAIEKINRKLKNVLDEINELQNITVSTQTNINKNNCDIIFFPKDKK